IQETAGTHRASLTFHFGVPTAEEEMSKELFEQALIARSGKMPYLDAQRPHDLSDPKLEKILRETQGGRFRMAHYALTQLGSEEIPPDPSMVRLSNRLGLVASFYPDIDMTDLGERWQVALSSGIQSFLFGQDSTALLQASYASSLKPADVKLANFLGKVEEYAGLKADRVPAESDRNLAQEFVFRAEAANNRGERDKVLTYLRDALFLEPNNLIALERIGSTYYVLGQYRLAIAVWQRALLLEPNAKEREVLGYYIEDARRKLDGGAPPPDLSILQEERKPEPEAPKPSAAPRPAPAPVKIRVGDPRDIPALYQKGVEHYARGEYLQATAMFMRILRIDPENIQAKKALERIQRMNQQR
ncbi:MAG: hypothetical protein HY551_06195, partial [Elusimicrobia bacterium]|nr:hypothetical protein [Elusimicrobiota bacterium]